MNVNKIIKGFLLFGFIGLIAPLALAAEPTGHVATVSNPYGIDALWSQGDFVSRGTLIILAIMSFGTWYIGVVKYFEQAKLFKQSKEVNEGFWQAKSIPAGIASLNEESAFRFIADSANKAVNKHDDSLLSRIDLSNWMDMSIQKAVNVVRNRLQGGLSFLATVGSTSPFVGLFGTVWGIYHALTAIGMSGQASIDKVAGPVGEALIMTAMGLAVAVPAVLGYNWLVRRNKVVMEQVQHFSAELHMVLLATGNKDVVK
ncbi:MAG: MotA/TolQ/ExbB proton channel family protein [Methylotenera sp.]|nr:MotA/TolQ/ExbB proton channel family protein [Methylotenera sp.]NOT64680.1 MotA/TolQ/ExbB proton channel family protein [Methylotenera sp.]